MSIDNTAQSRLSVLLHESGLSWPDATSVAQEWITSRYSLDDAIAFTAAGVLHPGDTNGAPRFSQWEPTQSEGRTSRKGSR